MKPQSRPVPRGPSEAFAGQWQPAWMHLDRRASIAFIRRTTSGMQFLAVAPLESAAGVTEKPESPITLIDASLRAECARNILP